VGARGDGAIHDHGDVQGASGYQHHHEIGWPLGR
jgi:hypothetical protein